jgi:hypothetical protein
MSPIFHDASTANSEGGTTLTFYTFLRVFLVKIKLKKRKLKIVKDTIGQNIEFMQMNCSICIYNRG